MNHFNRIYDVVGDQAYERKKNLIEKPVTVHNKREQIIYTWRRNPSKFMNYSHKLLATLNL